jgi:hypothetical protein
MLVTIVKDSSIDMMFDEQQQPQEQQQYMNNTDITVQEEVKPPCSFDQPNFVDLKRDHGWKYAIATKLINYFPHYTYQATGTCFFVHKYKA